MAQTNDSLAVETPLDSIQTKLLSIKSQSFGILSIKFPKTSQERPQISFQKNTIHTDLPPWEAPLLSFLPTLGSLEKAEILVKLSA